MNDYRISASNMALSFIKTLLVLKNKKKKKKFIFEDNQKISAFGLWLALILIEKPLLYKL